jgi:phosphate transport system permease protein
MSDAREAALVREDESVFERVADGVLAAGVLVFGLAFATLLGWLPLEATVGGLALPVLFGAVLVAMGVVVVAQGLLARAEHVDANPGHSVGVASAAAFGALAFVGAGLVASQTLGLSEVGLLGYLLAGAAGSGIVAFAGAYALAELAATVRTFGRGPVGTATRVAKGATALGAAVGLLAGVGDGTGAIGWSGVAAAVAVLVVATTLLPEEDVGSTLAPGLFVILVGAALLSGVVGPGWEWSITNFPDRGSQNPGAGGGVTGAIAVPGLTILAALLSGWAASKAREGFGAAGRQRGAFMLLYMNAMGVIAAMVLIVGFVVSKGAARAFAGFSVDLGNVAVGSLGVSLPFPTVSWPFVQRGYTFVPEVPNGVMPAIMGTVWIVLGATLLGVPLAVGAAVFLSEFAEHDGFTRAVEVATNALWSTPSIVYGLFGYVFIVPRLGMRQSILGGQLVLAFMLLPLVLITAREAIIAVPDEYRDASAALGVSKWETVRSVVLPAAMPGVVTGVILGIGRIAGETAPLLLVTGGQLQAEAAPGVLSGFRFTSRPPFVANDALLTSTGALPLRIWTIITHGVAGPTEQGWAAAFVLLVVVLLFYGIGIATRTHFRKKLNHE